MGIEINNHNTPDEEFSALSAHYPTGRYHKSQSGVRWFVFYIEEMNLELTWFNGTQVKGEEE